MNFDIDKIENLVATTSKKKNKKLDLTPEEIEFMANIFNTIIDSDNYDTIIDYLAGIHGMSISDIKFIRNIYYYYFASLDEKVIYSNKIKQIKKDNRRSGFIDLSTIITLTISLSILGIALAFLIYNII